MIRVAVLLLLLLLLAGVFHGAHRSVHWGAWAAEASDADAAGIRSAITRQLDAFRRDDAAGAYGHAAPNVREMFPTADGFLDMVRRGYQPVYRARDAEFGTLGRRDGALVQEVELIGPDGKAVLALYTMVPDGQGGWRIAACVLVPSARVGA